LWPDSSPLNYLIQIESANILHTLFGRVLVPMAVMQELRLFSRCREDDARGFRTLWSAQLAHETLYRLIATCKTVVGNQVLPDGPGIPATTESQLDELAVRFARAGRWLGTFRSP
jgi:hypothetical protein